MNSQEIKQNVDIYFCIDSTDSNQSIINVHYNNIEKLNLYLKEKYLLINFKLSFILFRDKVAAYYSGNSLDIKNNETELLNLTDNVEEIKLFLRDKRAKGGIDAPEDWVECFTHVLNQFNSKNTNIIFLLADEPPHGKEFGGYSIDAEQAGDYQFLEEGPKLIKLIEKFVENNIIFNGIELQRKIPSDGLPIAFNKFKEIYSKKFNLNEIDNYFQHFTVKKDNIDSIFFDLITNSLNSNLK